MINSMQAKQFQAPPLPLGIDWENIFRQHGKKLLNFIRHRVGNKEDVEDLAQMTYLEVLRNCHKFTGASRPETWVFGIAVNLIRSYYRNQRGRYLFDALDDDIMPAPQAYSDPSDIVESYRLLNLTLNSIAVLPIDIRQMLAILIDQDGSYQDVAVSLHIPVGTVRSRLSRAREVLKARVYS
ncbi:RNA polymerase sigma factor [Sodalis sp. dw_96]|uniref:RNA polymerase sigma factor n=1 Tax=Sodalis sp. dw_96 TaxID=2719794 RepID=UPI001BD4AF97|nr:RNA polymerase sigma factor [Sodalis sp. dw_96]